MHKMSGTLRSSITVKFSREAVHYWAGAALFPEVAFLQHPHRHVFHVSVQIEVQHDDREIEFFLFRRECEGLCTIPRNWSPVASSCEKFARELAEQVIVRYPGRRVSVSVSEDNENEATVTNE